MGSERERERMVAEKER
jgi:hypothetical protein